MPKNVEEGIIKGMYLYEKSKNKHKNCVNLLASGPIVNETIAASKILRDDWKIDSNIWSVTSFSELRRDAEDIEHWNNLNPLSTPKKSYIDNCLDSKLLLLQYLITVKLVAEQIAPFISSSFTALGTDGFGGSDTREKFT